MADQPESVGDPRLPAALVDQQNFACPEAPISNWRTLFPTRPHMCSRLTPKTPLFAFIKDKGLN
jgi:hypothetical protein